MGDVKENAMQGGVPSRLRGLDALGNSTSSTVEEVSSILPFGKTVYGVDEICGYTIFASCYITLVGGLTVSMGTQDSPFNSYWAMLYIMATGGVPSIRIISLIPNSIVVKYYYKVENGRLLIAAKDMSAWNHVSTTSFCERITPIFQKLTSIEGWTPIS